MNWTRQILAAIKMDGGDASTGIPEKTSGGIVAIHSVPPCRRSLSGKRKASASFISAEASTGMRDKLAAEIAGLSSVERAIEWAQKSIAVKNTLMDADASAVETAFRYRVQVLEVNQDAAADEATFASAVTASPPRSEIEPC